MLEFVARVNLSHTTSGPVGTRPKRVPIRDRDIVLSGLVSAGGLVCSAADAPYASLHCWAAPASTPHRILTMLVRGIDSSASALPWMSEFASTCHPMWATMSWTRSDDTLRLEQALAQRGRPPTEFRTIPWSSSFDPALPPELDWLNYWSARTVSALRLSLSAPALPSACTAVPSEDGGVVVRIGRDGLDFQDPETLDGVISLLERFPCIGYRGACQPNHVLRFQRRGD